jgi:alkylation response protein AidB-like acyl-CoA dehydrogenase
MSDPYLEAARRLAADVLVPAAERVDAEGVPRSHVAALKRDGLLGVLAPAECGGGGASPAVGREVTETLAGACGATWFVATQHGTPLRTVLATDNEVLRERWAGRLASSEVLAAIAVSQLRRPGRPPVTVTAAPGGWRFDGRVDWVTSWGLADVLLLAGVTPADDVVAVLIPAMEQPGLAATDELRLAAMSGAHNVAVRLDGLLVGADDVAFVQPRAKWLANDRLATANVTPAVFGLLATIVRRLGEISGQRGSEAGVELASEIDAEAAGLRAQAYALLDEAAPESDLPERLAIRGSALELLNRAAAALVVAGAGTSMLASNPAQRLAREALFYLVQASTPPMREAVLSRMAARTEVRVRQAD